MGTPKEYSPEYSFEEQLALGKKGEAVVLKHLRGKQETIDVRDLSDDRNFQALGVDILWVRENPTTNIAMGTFIDVKTDFLVHRTDRLFIETSSSAEKPGCMLTTKAEYFLYYDPVLGKLYYVPIYPLRKKYYGREHTRGGWIGKPHHTVRNKGYDSEGIAVSLEELMSEIPNIQVEDIPALTD